MILNYAYLYFQKIITDKVPDIKHVNLFFDQFVRNDREEGVRYPAVLIEFEPIIPQYLTQRIQNGVMNFNLYLGSHTAGSFRRLDGGQAYTLSHLDMLNTLYQAFDNVTPRSSYIDYTGITSDEDYYNFGTIGRSGAQILTRVGELLVSKISYSVPYRDGSSWYYNNYEDWNPESLSQTHTATGQTWVIAGGQGDFNSDFNEDFYWND